MFYSNCLSTLLHIVSIRHSHIISLQENNFFLTKPQEEDSNANSRQSRENKLIDVKNKRIIAKPRSPHAFLTPHAYTHMRTGIRCEIFDNPSNNKRFLITKITENCKSSWILEPICLISIHFD